jgi:hypothetical protein
MHKLYELKDKLMKELEDCDKNPIVETFKSSVRKLMPKGEKKLICDYFKG